MRKLISLLLALVMVMGLATVAFADNYVGVAGQNASIVKNYNVNYGTAPTEQFTFEITAESWKDNEGVAGDVDKMPEISDVTTAFTSFAAGELTDEVSIDLSNFANAALGVYTYKISEKAGNTAGINYDAEELYLVVSVYLNEQTQKTYVGAIHFQAANGAKTNKVENSYDAGKLTVTKNITGNQADMEKKFKFTIVLTAPKNEVVNSAISVSVAGGDATTYTFAEGETSLTITCDLGNGDSVVIDNIPEGVTYSISEEKGAYTASAVASGTTAGTVSEGENPVVSGSIAANDVDTATYTNSLSTDIDTGITLDSIPFVVMMIVCAAAAVLFVIKRRNSVEF